VAALWKCFQKQRDETGLRADTLRVAGIVQEVVDLVVPCLVLAGTVLKTLVLVGYKTMKVVACFAVAKGKTARSVKATVAGGGAMRQDSMKVLLVVCVWLLGGSSARQSGAHPFVGKNFPETARNSC
jgi:hypothetical protein